MQATPATNYTSSHEIQLVETPDLDFLHKISNFHRTEANWPTTEFELSLSNPIFAIVVDCDGVLLGTASIHARIPANYWVGNVVVAKRARRHGIAFRMVSALLQKISQQRTGPSYAVLVASKLGVNVYRRLGFLSQEGIVISAYGRDELPPPERSSSAPFRPNQVDHDAAVKLDEESIGINRSCLLNSIFQQYRLCAVVKVNSQVVGAGWGRISKDEKNGKLAELFVGPVVAKSPDFAISVTAELLRMEHHQRAGTKETISCRASTVLVLEKGEREESRNVFEALGYTKKAEMPYMINQLWSEPSSSSRDLDLVNANSQYFATAGWDIC